MSPQVPSGFQPTSEVPLTIRVGDLTVEPGSFVPIEKLREPMQSPAVDFSHVEGSSAHALVMLDLDPPLADKDRQYAPLIHWLAPIPSGTKSLEAGDASIQSLASYVAPKPPVESAPHRYVILLLAAPTETSAVPQSYEGKTYEDLFSRVNFDTDGFIKEGKFTVAAATWFTTAPPAAYE